MDNEKKEVGKNVKMKLYKKLFFTAAAIILIVILILVLRRFNEDDAVPALNEIVEAVPSAVVSEIIGEEGEAVYIASEATIRDIIEIDELNTVEYTYNSIVRVTKLDKDNNEEPWYAVSYNGTITAGIDFSNIDIAINEDSRTISITIPKAEIQSTNVDIKSLEYIFAKDKYNKDSVADDAYRLACDDLKDKAAKNSEILNLAKENAISAIEGLLEPWLSQIENGYTVNVN